MPYIRKATVDMEPGDWVKFKAVWETLNMRGTIGKYAEIHATYAQHSNMDMPRAYPINGPQGNNLLFLFWHSELVNAFEKEMHIIDDTVILPYWNAIKEPEGPPTLGDYLPEIITTQGHTIQPYREWGLDEGPPTSKMMTSALHQKEFDSFSGVWEGAFEVDGYHNRVHNWVGGNMATMSTAAYDPLFWVHHAFIEYIWVKWRTGRPLARGMPSSGSTVLPWETKCIDVYNNTQTTYLPPSGLKVEEPELVGLDLTSLIPLATSTLGKFIPGATSGGLASLLPAVTQGTSGGLASLLPTIQQGLSTLIQGSGQLPIATTAPTLSAAPLGLPIRLTGQQRIPDPTINVEPGLCWCGRPLGHPRKFRR